MSWCVYLLECNNGAYYAGITNDLPARFLAHQTGKGAKYTRANPPIKIIASKAYENRAMASVAEAVLKKLPRQQKVGFFASQEVELT
jgi:putative endonuclease